MRKILSVLTAGIAVLLAAGCATTVAGDPQVGQAAVTDGASTVGSPSSTTGPAGTIAGTPDPRTSEIPPVAPSSPAGPTPSIPVTGLPTIPVTLPTGTRPPTSARTSEQQPSTAAPSTTMSATAPSSAAGGAAGTTGATSSAASKPTSAPSTTDREPSTPVDQPATVDGHDSPWNKGGYAVFHSPSGNISCMMGDLAGDGTVMAMCEIGRHSYPTPARPSSCTLDYGDRFVLGAVGKATLGCHGDTVADPSAAVLPYGTSINYGSLACTSSESGMWCGSLDTGHYFKVASASYQLG